MLRVDTTDLDAVQVALSRAQTDTGQSMRAAAAAAVSAEWVPALTARAGTAQQHRLLVSGAGAIVTDTAFELIAGRGGSLSGGLDSSHWYAVDYGMTPRQRAAPTRRTSRRVRGGRVTTGPALIWVGRNLPARMGGNGRVIFATIADKSQSFVQAWVRGLMGTLDSTTQLDVTDAAELGEVRGSWQ